MKAIRLSILLAALLGLAVAAAPVADTIYVNGAIWTADPSNPRAEALAIAGDRLLAVGAEAEVRACAGPSTRVVDLRGAFVTPGFNDAHAHLPGPPLNRVDLAGAETLAEFQQRVAEYARTHPEDAWIVGDGWGYGLFPDKVAHRRHLDAVVSDRPVCLTERDYHMCLANSKALQLAGVTRDTPDPEHGTIVRDAGGEPTGELLERAQLLVKKHVPAPTPEQRYRDLLAQLDATAATGTTFVQIAHGNAPDHALFARARDAGTLKVRLRLAWPLEDPGNESGSARKLETLATLRAQFSGPLLEFGVLKGFVDGTVDGRTAAMLEPLVGGANGTPFWEPDVLNRTVAFYDRAGYQVMLHAIGDRAVRLALDAYAFAGEINGTTGLRHRVEHAEIVSPDDLPRFKALSVIAVTEPLYSTPDATTLGSFAVLLGPARAARTDAYRLFDDAGAVQAFASDWPVFPQPPLLGIYTAATRMTPAGTPPGGWFPENRIGVEAALRHYTIDGAYACCAEKDRGSLAAGKFADFVVLSEKLLEIPAVLLLETKVLLTVLGGQPTHRAEGW